MKSLRWSVWLIGGSLVSAAEVPDLESLVTTFSEPLYPAAIQGIPHVRNFDRRLTQPLLLVPPGLKEELSRVIDGDKAEILELSLTSSKQWIQIDLEEKVEIHGIRVWHKYNNPQA